MAMLRPRGSDDLGLRRALSDRLLPLLAAAMMFLAALALAGALAAAGLARHWQGGAAALVTVQVPDPTAAAPDGESRADAAAKLLQASAGVTARRLTGPELTDILRPWLGTATASLALDLPAMFELHLAAGTDAHALSQRLASAVPGSIVEQNSVWSDRLTALGRSLQASAALALLLVALVAVAVVAVATRAGLAARRDAIDILHGLGATDHLIAGRFATRITLLVTSGAVLGLILAIPLLLTLATLAAPFENASAPTDANALLSLLPVTLWAILPALPASAAAIAWLTAQATVRTWLARLP